MSTLLDITQEILEEEVTGIDDFIGTLGVELSDHLEIGDRKIDERLSDLMYLINIRDALAFYSVDSDFLTQADMRWYINQAKKVFTKIELPDNSIYQ